MKKFTSLLILASALLLQSAWAGESFVFDGTQNQFTFNLKGIEDHPVYKEVVVPRTCSRQELIGYETVCTPQWQQECRNVPYQRCHTENVCRDHHEQICHTTPGGVRECRPVSRPVCHPERRCYTDWQTQCDNVMRTVCVQEPRYRTVQYDCSTTERVQVGRELDFNVSAEVGVTFERVQSTLAPREAFTVSLSGDQVSLKLTSGSGNFLLFADKAQFVEIPAAKEKNIRTFFRVRLVPVAPFVEPFKQEISDLDLDGSIVKFRMGKITRPELLKFDLDIERRRALAGDKHVFDGVVDPAAITLSDAGDGTEVRIDLAKLKLAEDMRDGKKYNVMVIVKLDRSSLEKALNGAIVGEARLEGKSKIKND